MRWRIRYQLLVPPLLLLLGVVGVSVWTADASAQRARQRVEQRVRKIAENLEASKHTLRNKEQVLDPIKRYSGADLVLVQKDGPQLTTFDTTESFTPPDGVVDDAAAVTLGPQVVVGDKSYLCSGLRLVRKGGDIVYILYPEAELHEAISEARRPVFVLGGTAALASIALAVGLGQSLSRRLRQLERRTRLIASGDFSPMPLPTRNDEIRDLSRSINEMAEKLAKFQETVKRTERFRLLGQVSGGLAHQLRNGVTGAKLAVQLYRRETAEQTDAEPLDVALRQLTLLETHLKRFLDLGRQDVPRREACSLTALANDVIELVRPQCKHANIDLRWRPPLEPFTLSGDMGQLQQLLLNLLGNASDAAGPNGWVSLEICSQSDGVVVDICDSGPGVAKEVAERLFEPFVTGKPEGVGLGLAVARQVAEAHGGRISWERLADRTCFRVELPLMATPVSSEVKR
jgi:signal transduction histidine kinase